MNYFYLNSKKEQPLFVEDAADRNEIIEYIIKLRASLSDKESGVPEKKLTDNLILGTLESLATRNTTAAWSSRFTTLQKLFLASI